MKYQKRANYRHGLEFTLSMWSTHQLTLASVYSIKAVKEEEKDKEFLLIILR